MPEKPSISLTYTEAFERFSEPDWKSWFDPDAPEDKEFVYTGSISEEMLERGETLWSHPGWVKDVMQILRDWAQDDRLIRVRLFAEWLLTTLPSSFVDTQVVKMLNDLSQGHFCEAFTGLANLVQREREFYVRTGNLAVLSIVEDHAANLRATVNTKLFRSTGAKLL